MSSFRSACKIFYRIFCACVVLVVVISLLPQVLPPTVFYADKGLHFVAYSVLSTLAILSFPNRRRAVVTALSIAAVGVFVEIGQYVVPGRSPWLGESIGDLVANFVGVSLGIGCGLLIRARFAKIGPSARATS